MKNNVSFMELKSGKKVEYKSPLELKKTSKLKEAKSEVEILVNKQEDNQICKKFKIDSDIGLIDRKMIEELAEVTSDQEAGKILLSPQNKNFTIAISSDIKEELIAKLKGLQILLKDNEGFLKPLIQSLFGYLDDGLYENVTYLIKIEYNDLYSSEKGGQLLDTVGDLISIMEGKIYLYRSDIMAKFEDAGISKSSYLKHWQQEIKKEVIEALPSITF